MSLEFLQIRDKRSVRPHEELEEDTAWMKQLKITWQERTTFELKEAREMGIVNTGTEKLEDEKSHYLRKI